MLLHLPTPTLGTALFFIAMIPVFPAEKTEPGAQAASAMAPLRLERIYRMDAANQKRRFATREQIDVKTLPLEDVAFLAVVTNHWPTGLVPIFMVEKTNRVELRRRPVRGQENSYEPLFFALPPVDEPDAAKITGRWDCQAVRGNGDKDYPVWELAIEGDQISGRFDQGSQYRVAYLTGGTFRAHRIELRAEYNSDVYLLSGEWHEGEIKGTWRHLDADERGTWQASRPESRLPSSRDVVSLYEWRRSPDNARRYSVEEEKIEPEWERSPRPLCRVWRAPRSQQK